MSKRSFDPGDLVLLPILDASSAEALGKEMLALAGEEELDRQLEVTVQRLSGALEALSGAARARLDLEPAREADRREAYREETTAFAGLHDWLNGWSRVPEEVGGEKVGEAKRIYAALFGAGLKFLKLPHKAGWIEADHRIQWLEAQKVDGVFKKLGGLAILEHVRAAHERTGEVLGITKARETVAEPPSIRDPLDAFLGVLREYVVQVAALATFGDEEARAMAARLLAPLAQWQSPRQERKAEPPRTETPPAPPSG